MNYRIEGTIFEQNLIAMKKNLSIITLLSGFVLLIAGAIILNSCEGPMGPQGPEGPAGQDGVDGVDGKDGVDGVDGTNGTDGTDGVAGNAVCLECHNLATKAAVTADYKTSGHGLGLYVSYAGGRYDCAMCHSNEGFIETQRTGMDTTAADIPLPTTIGCTTCHDFHESLDFENEPNSAIRTSEPVTLLASGNVVEFEDHAEANLCMNCHQARRAAPDDADGAAPFEVPNTHWGAHHGPQANLLNGEGGYEFGVSLTAATPHESGASCVTCHMDESSHTFEPEDAACLACHSSVPPSDDIETLLATLEAALQTAGLLDAEAGIVPDTFGSDSAGALWNYLLIEEDRSMGVHNPGYAKALLNNSILALE